MGGSWSGINGRHWHDTLKNKLYFYYYL
jgi:hypothetical protein